MLLQCCIHVHWHRNMITEPLPRNDSSAQKTLFFYCCMYVCCMCCVAKVTVYRATAQWRVYTPQYISMCICMLDLWFSQWRLWRLLPPGMYCHVHCITWCYNPNDSKVHINTLYGLNAKCFSVRAGCLFNYCHVLKGEVQNYTYILRISLKYRRILVTLGTVTV
jgi:hypothetical protein